MDELEELRYKVNADDEDGNRLSYCDNSNQFDIDESGLDCITRQLKKMLETYSVEIIASDGKLNVSSSFNIHVKNVNRAPELEQIKDIIIDEASLAEINIIAADRDNDAFNVFNK